MDGPAIKDQKINGGTAGFLVQATVTPMDHRGVYPEETKGAFGLSVNLLSGLAYLLLFVGTAIFVINSRLSHLF
jgi:hypothetical protein